MELSSVYLRCPAIPFYLVSPNSTATPVRDFAITLPDCLIGYRRYLHDPHGGKVVLELKAGCGTGASIPNRAVTGEEGYLVARGCLTLGEYC